MCHTQTDVVMLIFQFSKPCFLPFKILKSQIMISGLQRRPIFTGSYGNTQKSRMDQQLKKMLARLTRCVSKQFSSTTGGVLSLAFNKDQGTISGTLKLTPIDASKDKDNKYSAVLDIKGEYYSMTSVTIPDSTFKSASFEIDTMGDFSNVNNWWFKGRGLRGEISFELWQADDRGNPLRVLVTNPTASGIPKGDWFLTANASAQAPVAIK